MDTIQEVIHRKIQPVLAAHQGGVEFVELTSDGYVKVRLTGACSTCPGAQQTVSEVIEAALREACPEIRGVIPVFQVSEELIQTALRMLRKGENSHAGTAH